MQLVVYICIAQLSGVGAHDKSSQSVILGCGIFDGGGIDAEEGVDDTGTIAVVGTGIVVHVGVGDVDGNV